MSDDVDRAFHALKLEYLASMAERLEELRSDAREFRAGKTATEASLKVRLHRLAGSGGSYGFSQLSSVAREAERWLDARPGALEADRLSEMIERIAGAVAEAEAALRSGG
jgi:HPt (histidine-containing phosphotransfer) domain-containing protein